MNQQLESADAALASSTVTNTRHVNWEQMAALYARLALGTAFLSAVSGRFGIWDGRFDVKHFSGFLEYAGEVLRFMPKASIPFLAWAATACETTLGILLIAGIWPNRVSIASAILLAMFGTSMAISLGLKSPMDYSVFSASSAAVLLALHAYKSEETESR
jgi:putative oxidoreductase